MIRSQNELRKFSHALHSHCIYYWSYLSDSTWHCVINKTIMYKEGFLMYQMDQSGHQNIIIISTCRANLFISWSNIGPNIRPNWYDVLIKSQILKCIARLSRILRRYLFMLVSRSQTSSCRINNNNRVLTHSRSLPLYWLPVIPKYTTKQSSASVLLHVRLTA